MNSNGHPYLVESQRKLVTLYENMYNTSKERCPAAFGQKRTSMVENIYVASPIAQLYAEKLAQPPPTIISPAPRILKVPVPQSTPLVYTHRAETQMFINRPHSIGADPANVTSYYDPSTIQPFLNRSTSFVHGGSVSAIPGPSLNSSGSSVGDFHQDSHSHEPVSHYHAPSHTVSSPAYQNAYVPDSCDSTTPPGSPGKHVPLKSLTPEFVAIGDEQVVVCRMPDRRETSLDVSAENHYPEYTSPLSCYSKRPCRLIQELDKVKELSKNEVQEGRGSSNESCVKNAGTVRSSFEISKVSQVSQADRLNNVDLDSEVLDPQAPGEGSDVSDGIEDEIDELKPYTDGDGEGQCSSPEPFERLALHKKSPEIEDIGAEDVLQSKRSTSVRNPSCDSLEDDEVDRQRTQNVETFSTSESETDISDSDNGGTFEKDAKEDMVDEVDLLTGLSDSNPKKSMSRQSKPEVDVDTYTKRDSDFKEETSKNRYQIKRTKQPSSKKHAVPIAETQSDTDSPKRPQENSAQSLSRKKRSSASSEMNIDTDMSSSRNQGNTIKRNAVQLDHKKAKKSEAGHKFSQKKMQEMPAVTPRSSRSKTLHETPTTSMPKKKVKEYVLTEWIIRPINSCKGVFVEGKVEGREDDFWHSTAIVKRLSNSRVQSNSGSQYVLVGPIDREYTLDAGFSRKTVNAFKKGFPSEWREVISKHFEEADRSESAKKPEKFQEIQSTPKNGKKPQKNKSHSLLSDSSDINVKDLPRTRSGRRVFPQLAWWACQRVKSFPQADVDLVEVTPPSAAMNTSISSSRHVNIKTDERSLRLKELMKKRLLEKRKKHKDDPSTTVSDSEESFSRLADGVTDEASEGSRKVRGQIMVKEKSVDQESPKNGNVRKQLKEKEVSLGKKSSKVKATKSSTVTTKDKDIDDEMLSDADTMSSEVFTPNNRRKTDYIPGGQTSDSGKIDIESYDLQADILGVLNTERAKRFKPDSEQKTTCYNKAAKLEKKLQGTNNSHKGPRVVLVDLASETSAFDKNQDEHFSPKSSNGRADHGDDSSVLDATSDTSKSTSRIRTLKDNDVKQSHSKESDNIEVIEISSETEPGGRWASLKTSKRKNQVGKKELKALLATSKSITQNIAERSTRPNKGTDYTMCFENADYNSDDSDVWTPDKDGGSKTKKHSRTGSEEKTLSKRSAPAKACKSKRRTRSSDWNWEERQFDTASKRHESGAQKKNGSHRERQNTTQSKAFPCEDGDASEQWSQKEINSLQRALRTVPPSTDLYWHVIAQKVGTRSASQCQQFHQKEVPSTEKSQKKKKNDVKEQQVELTGKVGTMKRKRQLRELIQQHEHGYEDDFFDSTPFRKSKKVKLPTPGDSSEEEEETNISVGGAKGKFFTPVVKTGRHWAPRSEKKTPHSTLVSPGLLKSVNRNEVDQYINKLKRGKKGFLLQKTGSKQEKKPVRTATTTMPQSDIFQVKEVSDEDSEEEKDFYYSDEEGNN